MSMLGVLQVHKLNETISSTFFKYGAWKPNTNHNTLN